MVSQLTEVATRAGLLADDKTEPGRLQCSYPARWPGVSFAVMADPGRLEAVLNTAALDVDHLWPGRAINDGALSLMAIALQEVLDVRREAPVAVVLAPSGLWVSEPAERSSARLAADSEELEWRGEHD